MTTGTQGVHRVWLMGLLVLVVLAPLAWGWDDDCMYCVTNPVVESWRYGSAGGSRFSQSSYDAMQEAMEPYRQQQWERNLAEHRAAERRYWDSQIELEHRRPQHCTKQVYTDPPGIWQDMFVTCPPY